MVVCVCDGLVGVGCGVCGVVGRWSFGWFWELVSGWVV